MPDYGDVGYWNNRYAQEYTETFDWLFEYKDVANVISQIFKPSNSILMIGSGNATFSQDMYNDGFKKITNIDLSDVVVAQMQKKFPDMEWKVMDALDMSYKSGTIENIIDKSLIDTVFCYKNSVPCTKQLIRESYRVLAPGGILLTFSLHTVDEIVEYFRLEGLEWNVSTFRIRNPRWDNEDQCRRSIAHSMVVCQKPPTTLPHPLPLTGVLSDQEYEELRILSDEIRDNHLFSKVTINEMVSALDVALCLHASETQNSDQPCAQEKTGDDCIQPLFLRKVVKSTT